MNSIASPTALAPRRRLTWLLFFGQSMSSAAFIAGGTVGALVAEHLSGRSELAGLPGAVYLVGAAAAAYPASRLMERVGRRVGLVAGYAIGVAGALLAGFAVISGSLVGFLLGYCAMGAAKGFGDFGRYAAAEMHPFAERARAISMVVLGGTVGAVAGPALVAPMGQLATTLNADALAGPWFASAALFAVGVVAIGLGLRPDPRDLARHFAGEAEQSDPSQPVRPQRVIWGQPGTRVAIAAMVVGQLVMVMLMSITSLHMTHNGHGLGDVSLVIAAHTLGMFGLSLISGRLADNFGRPQTILAGAGLLIAACLLAPLSLHTGVLAAALFLLGLGWNFCYVAGAALLTDTLTLAERARMQGSNDLLVGIVSALGSLQSGALFAWIGYGNLSWLSLLVSLLPLGMALHFLVRRRQAGLVAG
jgi:MFS family permease